MLVKDLSGAELDYFVAKAEGHDPTKGHIFRTEAIPCPDNKPGCCVAHFGQVPYPIPKYSSNWSQGGPIIEREKIAVSYQEPDHDFQEGQGWFLCVKTENSPILIRGKTQLIAAMRAYVASKFGDEV